MTLYHDPPAGPLPFTSGEWHPLFRGAEADRAWDAIEAVAGSLRPALLTDDSAFLAQTVRHAAPNLAVLHAYMARALPAREADAAAVSFLQAAARLISDTPMTPALYGGFTGVAWTVAHLQAQLCDPSAGDPAQEMDELLLERVSQTPWNGGFDLISGLVGIGVYAMERAFTSRLARELLAQVIERLEEMAAPLDGGLAWPTRPDLLAPQRAELYPDGYCDLGLAHGTAGVIPLLGYACRAGIASGKARPLLDGAVRWLLGQRLAEGTPSLFPAWVAPGQAPHSTRLAWCYGDPGIAAALFLAARCAGEAGWEREALAIARRAATQPPDGAGVNDAGLCHGAAGLGHIFNRLFQATGDPILGDGARYWLGEALSMRRPGEGIGGFLVWSPTEAGKADWQSDPGLLVGAAGTALALLAAVTNLEPEWDRMLLLSLPLPPLHHNGR